MIARGSGDEPPPARFLRDAQRGVEGPADLVGARRLDDFELEEDVAAREPGQPLGSARRRPEDPAPNAASRSLDVVDGNRLDRRPLDF
jgi:hypothetical protein